MKLSALTTQLVTATDQTLSLMISMLKRKDIFPLRTEENILLLRRLDPN
jgi:hypothetical protein